MTIKTKYEQINHYNAVEQLQTKRYLENTVNR